MANLPIEQGDRGIDGPSRSRPRLLDEGADVFEQIARLASGIDTKAYKRTVCLLAAKSFSCRNSPCRYAQSTSQ
jgi:hypothetical protein